jgi:hypothetical protein
MGRQFTQLGMIRRWPVTSVAVRIVVDLSNGTVDLSDPDAFDRFSVDLVGEGSEEALAAVVERSGLGGLTADGTHLAVDPVGLRRLAGAAVTPAWEAGFEGMCAYAAGKGWVEADGAILAHIERPDGAA